MSASLQDETLRTLRQELVREDLLRDEDSIGTDDETLLRFLRARDFDLYQSKKMFADCQQWRKTVEGIGIDNLYREMDPFDYPEREVVFQYWPMWTHKTDKKGRPINFQTLGKIDLAKLYQTCTPERHWKSILVTAECVTRELLPAATLAAGEHIGGVLVIVDLHGFGLSQFWQARSLVRNSFQVTQDYYPETMGQLVVINAPSSFTIIWSMVKPWLSKETLAKVDVLGSDYQHALLDLVDAESLPSSLGGQCTCADLGNCELSAAGPWLNGRTGWGPKAQKAEEDAGMVDRASPDDAAQGANVVEGA